MGRIKLLLIGLLISCIASAQYPAGYTGINTRYDWLAGKFRAVHIPAGTTPALTTGQFTGAGALYLDSANHIFYFYSGGAWRRANIDTSGQFITSLYRKTASDSVFYVKGGVATFAFKDSIGASGNFVDSLRRVGVNVQAQKSGVWTTQYTDSIGEGNSPWIVNPDSSLNYYTAAVTVGGTSNGLPIVNPATTLASGYYTISTAAGNISNNPISWINKLSSTRIRQSGNISQIKFYIQTKSGADFYFDTWRFNGTTYDRINHINVFSLMSSGMNTITLPVDAPALAGDYTGFSYNTGSAITSVVSIADASFYSFSMVSSPQSWASTAINYYFPVQCFMSTGPDFVGIGNSIMAGASSSASGAEFNITTGWSKSVTAKLDSMLGSVTQNMGISGEATAAIQARFKTDATDLNPKAVLIEGIVNAVATGETTVAVLAKLVQMFDSCVANDIRPIYLQSIPCTVCDNAESAQLDTIDFKADSIIRLPPYNSYSVNAKSSLGQFRVGGAPGNYWDLQTPYSDAGIHLTEAGNIVWAGIIKDTISNHTGNTPSNASVSFELLNNNQYMLLNNVSTTSQSDFVDYVEGGFWYNRTIEKPAYYNGSEIRYLDSNYFNNEYILNGTSEQPLTNYNISGNGTMSQALITQRPLGADPTNNSFETPSISANSYQTGAPTGWTGNVGVVKIYPPSAYLSPTAPNGNQVMGIEEPGYMETTTYAPGAGTYQLSLYIALNSGTKSLSILVDGVTVYTGSSFTSSYVKYTSSAFTTTAGNHTLRIETTGSGTILFDYIQTISAPAVYIQKWVTETGATAMLVDSAGHIFVPGATAVSGTTDSALIRDPTTKQMSMKAIAGGGGVVYVDSVFINGSNDSLIVLKNGFRYASLLPTGGGSTPAGNYGNIQLNRNAVLATPASDSLDFDGGLNIKGTISATSLSSGAVTDSVIVATGGTGALKKINVNVIAPADTMRNVSGPTGYTPTSYSPRQTFNYQKAVRYTIGDSVVHTDRITPTDSTASFDLPTYQPVQNVGTNDLTATTDLMAYTTPSGAVGIYEILLKLKPSAVGGGGVLTTVLTYKDEDNETVTYTMITTGAASTLTGTGTFHYPTIQIAAYPSTEIKVTSTLTVGSMTYNAYGTITYVRKIAL